MAVKKELSGDARVRFDKNNMFEWFVVFDGADGSLDLENEMLRTNRFFLSDGFGNI